MSPKAMRTPWNDGSEKPDAPGNYYRLHGKATNYAYWDGVNWFHVSRNKTSGERVYESPHRSQNQPWRGTTPRGVENLPEPGDRFGALRFVRDVGYDAQFHRWLVIFRCDCGCEKAMNLYEVRNGRNKSCGCLRSAPEVLARQAAGRAKWQKENHTEQVAMNRALGYSRIGSEQPMGPSGKWSLNVHSKYWALLSPDGAEFSGWNLAQIIRDNEHLFAPEDLAWEKGMCRASKGLRGLFEKNRDGRFRAKVWKGWRKVEPPAITRCAAEIVKAMP